MVKGLYDCLNMDHHQLAVPFLSLHSAFCDPCVISANEMVNEILIEISLPQTKSQKSRSKYRSHKQNVVRNFVNFVTISEFAKWNFAHLHKSFANSETIEACKIWPKIQEADFFLHKGEQVSNNTRVSWRLKIFPAIDCHKRKGLFFFICLFVL